jgi:hypothetical protein
VQAKPASSISTTAKEPPEGSLLQHIAAAAAESVRGIHPVKSVLDQVGTNAK